MGCFVCLLRLGGDPVTGRDRERVNARIRRKGLRLQEWVTNGGFAATVVKTRLRSSPSIVSAGPLSLVGTVRLDNREEFASRDVVRNGVSDLELVGASLRDRGRQSIVKLIGDFAFACWDSRTRSLLAARDSLGIKHLFWSLLEPDLVGVGSHPSLLAQDGAYSPEYIAHWFARSHRAAETVYCGVHLVPAGSIIRVQDGRVVVDEYWSLDHVPLDVKRSVTDYGDEFRDLFQRAVRLRLPDEGRVWAELSGGLDTSSVVMTAEDLHRTGAAPTRITGTLTYTDSLSSGADESTYVSAVVSASGLPNRELRDYWPWQDDGRSPPETETPGLHTIGWARERYRDAVLEEAGADALLTGAGGDILLGVNAFYVADWVSRGHFIRTWREIIDACARGHHRGNPSVWKFALEKVAAPLLPTALRSRYVTRDDWVVPGWVNGGFRRRYGIDSLARSRRLLGGPRGGGGRTYHKVLMNQLRLLESSLDDPGVNYERRHPFLYRPLAEFALRLPEPRELDRRRSNKWVLREGMRGILPEVVRTRTTKGSHGARVLWSLVRERRVIEWMLRDPILAQMGCIDTSQLRAAYSDVKVGRAGPDIANQLFRTLALETWLRIKSGQWLPRAGQEVQVRHHVISTQGDPYEYAKPRV